MWHGSTAEGGHRDSDCHSWSTSSYAATGTASIFMDTENNNALLEQIDVRCDRPLAVLCVLSSADV